MYWNETDSTFGCSLRIDRDKTIFLGNFQSEIDAATVYDMACSMNFGYNENNLNVWKSKDKKDITVDTIVSPTRWTFCEACETWQVTASTTSETFRCRDVFRPCFYEHHDESNQEQCYGHDTYESRILLLRDWIEHRYRNIPGPLERSVAWIALVSRTMFQVSRLESIFELKIPCSDLIKEWIETTSDMLRCANHTHLSHSRPVLLTAPFANTCDRVFTTLQNLSVETEWWTCLLKAADKHLPPLNHLDTYKEKILNRLKTIQDHVRELEALDIEFACLRDSSERTVGELSKLALRWDSEPTKVGGIELQVFENFNLPSETYPNYGTRLGLTYGKAFRASPGGALVKRGVVKLTEEERRRLGHKTCWMEGLFLAEKLPSNAYVMDYEGVKRRESQVHGTNRESSAEYRKFRTHVLKIGRYLIDASDTKRFPAGLLNTCPKGANSCSVRGKVVTLRQSATVNTMLCINYGKSYITDNFIKFKCYPLDESKEKQKMQKRCEERMRKICTCRFQCVLY